MSWVKRRRGAVLIVVLGVLAILALLATTFATLQTTERRVARNYLDTVRARLLAQSGVEHAVAHLREQVARSLLREAGPEPSRYWGNDLDEEGPAAGPLDVRLEEARNPSFALEVDDNPQAGAVTPRQILIAGKPRGLSGAMASGTYARHGDVYSLRVSDASGKIYLNEGLSHFRGNDSTASRTLKRILNRLGTALTPRVGRLGDRVVERRPMLGFRSVRELKDILDDREYEAVKDHVTAQAWVDPNVANPVPFGDAHAAAIQAEFGIELHRGSPALHRFGRGKDYRGNPVGGALGVQSAAPGAPAIANSLAHAVYAMDELSPVWIEATSRAPVNVNAASREVLVALLSDLRGVFMAERRRNNVPSYGGGYHFISIQHTFSPDPMPANGSTPSSLEGDELGFLYETYPILGPGTTGSGLSAASLAEHFLACRERRSTRAVTPGFDYADPQAAFRGPFRSWRQFNAFCDHLVKIGVLEDPRPIFFDYAPGPLDAGNVTGQAPLVPSDFQRRVAAQAIADVLKANFNPNLHLNELNPDRNLYLLVDKTDLVVNSTEFIFTPTGYYDIESLGRVIRPMQGEDAFAAADNEVIAEAKIEAGVKLFDLYRETQQGQFAAGECSLRPSGPATNNNRALEVGPEPDNGPAPRENQWSGYIAFPTIGGNFHREVGTTKPPGDLKPTPAGGSEFGETIHSHLSWDFDAHFHADGDAKRKDMGSNTLAADDQAENFADPGEGAGGPYDPIDQNNRHRLARSFRLGGAPSSTTSLPGLARIAPMDLRIDGGYSERHSGLAYWLSPTSYVPNTAAKQGVMSFWIKPNFYPERTGKPRLLTDLSRLPTGFAALSPSFIAFWNAGHGGLPYTAPPMEGAMTWNEANTSNPGAPGWGFVPFKPQTILFGTGYGHVTRYNDPAQYQWTKYEHWTQTPSLNHEAHDDNKPSLFKGHEWMHVVLCWKKTLSPQYTYSPVVPSWPTLDYKIMVNGKLLPGSVVTYFHRPQAWIDDRIDWTVHGNNDRNSLRFGSLSRACRAYSTDNFAADSTIDEIYFWNSREQEAAALTSWLLGRYAYPQGGTGGGGALFTSQELRLASPTARAPAPSSRTSAPDAPPAIAPASSRVRILGISWTWFAEDSALAPDGRWAPILTDHGSGATLFPLVEASVLAGSRKAGPGTDDGYSPLFDSSGNPFVVPADVPVRYRLNLQLPGTALDTILLTTPVVDDVTIYFATDESEYTHYSLVRGGV